MEQKEIGEHYKTQMLSQGEWLPTAAEKTDDRVIGFHLSSLYSPIGWLSWEQCARDYEAAKNDDQLLKSWANTTLGIPWEEKGDSPDWGVLFDRRESYKIGTVPLGGYVLTAGVDVQNDRIELEIVAWGRNHESWSVDYKVILGSPSSVAPWKKLTEILQESFPGEDGITRKINMLAIDSGFSSQDVYNWVRSQSAFHVMAVKGVDNALVPLNSPTKVDVNYRGKKISGGVRLWKVGVSMLKSELYGWLKHTRGDEKDAPYGYAHFPQYNTEYFKQLTAEQLVTHIVKGYPKREWQKTRDRNEALDCRIYARAAAIALGIDNWSERKWQKIIENTGVKEEKEPQKEKPRPRVVRSGWM